MLEKGVDLLRRLWGMESLEDTSLPEEIYFQVAAEYIEKSEGHQLYMLGIDQPFMENSFVKTAFARVLGEGRRMEVVATARAYGGLIPSFFADFPDQVRVDRTDILYESGFIILGKSGVMIWDNNRVTKHPLEKERNVPFRAVTPPKEGTVYLQRFHEHQEKALPEPLGDLDLIKDYIPKLFRLQ